MAIHRLTDFGTFRGGILRQPFADSLGTVLVWTLPPLEIATVVLLVMDRTRYWGVWLSAVLMAGFTAYVGIALLGAWGKLPCGCGSVIAGLSWRQHFFFNLFFLLLSVAGIHFVHRQRVRCAKGTADSGWPAKRQDKM